MSKRPPLNEIITYASAMILKFTPQLYKRGSMGKMPIGTGVLFQHADSYFLITASHIFQRDDGTIADTNIGFVIGDMFIYLLGNVKYSGFDGSEVNEFADLAICQLEDETVELLKPNYEFLSIEQIDIDHDFWIIKNYLFVGFPVNWSRADFHTGKITPKPFPFITAPMPVESIEGVSIDPNLRVFVYFDKKNVANHAQDTVNKSPDLEGVSGCGLWRLSMFRNNVARTAFKLVAIVLQHHPKQKAVSCLRIEVVTEALRMQFGCQIPASKKLGPIKPDDLKNDSTVDDPKGDC